MSLFGLLPDHEILRLGRQLIEPFNERCVQPASYDLALHEAGLVPPLRGETIVRSMKPIDLRVDKPREAMTRVSLENGYVLLPGQCLLASTVETIHCASNIVARVEGKSSLGRLFLAVHVTAGWVDAGWSGQITLEVVNHGPWSIKLWAGMKIAQINFTRLAEPCTVPYGSPQLGSHYQAQQGPTAAVGERALEHSNRVQEGTVEEVGRRG
jgi:dCTP deaminase